MREGRRGGLETSVRLGRLGHGVSHRTRKLLQRPCASLPALTGQAELPSGPSRKTAQSADRGQRLRVDRLDVKQPSRSSRPVAARRVALRAYRAGRVSRRRRVACGIYIFTASAHSVTSHLRAWFLLTFFRALRGGVTMPNSANSYDPRVHLAVGSVALDGPNQLQVVIKQRKTRQPGIAGQGGLGSTGDHRRAGSVLVDEAPGRGPSAGRPQRPLLRRRAYNAYSGDAS